MTMQIKYTKIEKIGLWIILIWLALNTIFGGPPGDILCEICEEVNHKNRVLYLFYFLIIFIACAILVWRLYRPSNSLRIISFAIAICTFIMTYLMLVNGAFSFFDLISFKL
jgi:hypothetical protein